MGRPVYFSVEPKEDTLAEALLEQAAGLAGFKRYSVLCMNLSAPRWLMRRKLSSEEIAFVFDFGGGTLDFTVIRLGPERPIQRRSHAATSWPSAVWSRAATRSTKRSWKSSS